MRVSLESTYKVLKIDLKDEALSKQIQHIMLDHPFYGQRRLQIALGFKGLIINHKRLRRVCLKYQLRAKVKTKRYSKPEDQGLLELTIPNQLKPLQQQNLINKPNQIWCMDFTYFNKASLWYYLFTVIDVYTKEIVGYSFGVNHPATLAIEALEMAIEGYGLPEIVHSDQGSEYQSNIFTKALKAYNTTQSFSAKASPWQNPYQETFYGKFKDELELYLLPNNSNYQQIYQYMINQLEYYNNYRIHTVIKNIPARFRQNYYHKHGLINDQLNIQFELKNEPCLVSHLLLTERVA